VDRGRGTRSVNAAAAPAAEEHDKSKQRNQEQQWVNGDTARKGDHEQYDSKSYEHFSPTSFFG
jgi:hypothetical protein